ncbi:MAG TPA: phosphodiester glycosidase family protein [Vicinamibacterales bacterium]|nr:phosphodiester glycosidase family protein [Vicinamibacterales bacterium]
MMRGSRVPERYLRLTRVLVVLAAVLAAACSGRDAGWLGPPSEIAPGVEFFRSTDGTLLDPRGPIAVHLLRLDPERVRLTSVLSQDEVLGAETVEGMAARRGAIAAINGGFFNVGTGEPVGLLKVARELVSDTGTAKGAVVINAPADGETALVFDQISVRMSLTFQAGDRQWSVPIDGVDTTRARGRLMLYTPTYHADTDTAANGTEWVLSGNPMTVTGIRRDLGRTAIPRDGAVLSFGGLDLPEPLAALEPGAVVGLGTEWRTMHGTDPAVLDAADHIVQGAGLIRRDGRSPGGWVEVEGLRPDSFIDVRHPRTLVGVDRRGFIWLVAVDGRRPDHSVGMTFSELDRLAGRLGLTDALNLDGGGSTTMVVNGQVVNRPSDSTGLRPVSDALVVTLR